MRSRIGLFALLLAGVTLVGCVAEAPAEPAEEATEGESSDVEVDVESELEVQAPRVVNYTDTTNSTEYADEWSDVP